MDLKDLKRTDELTKELLQKTYAKSKNLNEVAKKLGERPKIIKRYFDVYQIPYNMKPVPRYKCNHNYFSQDTQEVFYIAGFIAADGCITDRKNSSKRLEINLGRADRELLIKIKRELEAEHPIDDYAHYHNVNKKIYKSSRLCISSKQICDDLLRFGITPRKSFIYKMPEWLTQHPLVRHFIRGYNDGDGGFQLQQKKNEKHPQIRMRIFGTLISLTQMRDIILKECNLPPITNVRPHRNIFVLSYLGNRKVGKIIDFLYQDATIFLDRKEKIASSYSFINNYLSGKRKKGQWAPYV